MLQKNNYGEITTELYPFYQGRVYKDIETLLANNKGVEPRDISAYRLLYSEKDNCFYPLVEDKQTALDISY